MKVVAKPIEVIAYFQNDGKINPIKFRVEDDDKSQVIKIGKIISTDREKLCGNLMNVYTCSAIVDGIEKLMEIKYDIEKCRWILFKI